MFFNAVEKTARVRLIALWRSRVEPNADRSYARMTIHERMEEIYETERESIYSYLLGLRVPPGRAQELTQDSFLKLYLKMSRDEHVENPRAWLYRVAHNFALRFHQREPVFDELGANFAMDDPANDPENRLIELQRHSALVQAIRCLSPQQRNCLHLRVKGLRYREIGEVIGISTSAVGEFLKRAVTRLKEAMDGH
jgi:RNA polymerase sigma-70 factor, ECF subfamily